MNWTCLIWIGIYFAVGWVLGELCNCTSDVGKLVMFSAWPVIIGIILLTVMIFFVVGLIEVFITLFDRIYTLLYKGD